MPLHMTVVRSLQEMPRLEGCPRVFWQAKDPDWISQIFRKAVRAAGIENFKLHDLRHSFASLHAMSGTDLLTIQHLLGHNDPRMTTRYAHLSPAHLQRASALFSGFSEEENPEEQLKRRAASGSIN